MATYKRICAWCNPPRVMEIVEVPDNSPMAGKETHGICATCATKLRPTVQDHRDLVDKAEELLNGNR